MSTYTESKTEPQAPRDNRNIVYALLTILLLAALGYIWYSKKTEKENDVVQQQALVASNTVADENDANYKAALITLDSITNLNTTLNGEITNKEGNVAKLRTEIEALMREGKKDDASVALLNNKIAALNREINGYKDRVGELTKQNEALTAENTTVKTERDQVKEELATTKTVVEKTTTEKNALEDKVDVGGTLSASQFSIAGINERRNGKEKETSTAKRVDKLRIGFMLDANRITTSGIKKVYVCITAPDGTPVTVPALGSGKMTTKEDGEKAFTNLIDVDYIQGQPKLINFDWKSDNNYQQGDYKVEVYQNGFKIGQGKATLKKGGLFS